MTRQSRTAVLAALFALCTAVHAEARLDPARVFHPGSGSFLTLSFTARYDSPFEASVFNEGSGLALLPAPSEGSDAVAFAGAGTVSLTLPEIRATFTPALNPGAPYVPAAIPTASVGVASPSAVPLKTAPIVASGPALAAPAVEAPHFGSYAPYAPALTGQEDTGLLSAHVGKMQFQTAFAAMQKCGTADEASACAQGMSAGTAFNVRAGNRDLNVSLESGVSHVTQDTAGVFPYVPIDPDAQAGISYAGVTDVFGQNVGAQLAVPLTRRITVGLQFDRTHYQGSSVVNDVGFEGMRDTYLGNLTYQMPGSSFITLSARQYRYQDLMMPALTSTQTRADLNFTVKF